MKKKKYIIIALLIIGVFFISYGFNLKNITPNYSYKMQRRTDYEVLLKHNNFYENERLPSGKWYASKSIDSYIINFIYNFSSDKKIDMKYKYFITANLIGTFDGIDGQDKEVWNREVILTNLKEEYKKELNNFNINEQVNIDYEYYNDLARSYENKYGIVIDTNLIIKMNIFTNINEENIEDTIEIEIPITDTVSNVKENYEAETTKIIYSNNQNFKNIYIVIGTLFLVIAILIVFTMMYRHQKIISMTYNFKLKSIMKNYEDIIVTVMNVPNIKNLDIMNVINFEDLVDIAIQTQNIIIHFEKLKNKESIFYVLKNDYAYVYTLK